MHEIAGFEKKYLTTPPTRGMIVSTEPMFYGARAAARAQRGALHEASFLPARGHPGAFHFWGKHVMRFAFRALPLTFDL